jgi:hypothetical protein
MALPISVPNTFATATGNLSLATLDANFTAVVNGVNGIGNGTNALSNVAITGGTISNTTISLPTLNGGPLAGLRNRIINGNMAVDQRNSGGAQTIPTASAYTVDRWIAAPSGASVNGQRITGSAPSQYRYQINGAASVTGIGFSQRIEAANTFDLAGKTCTISVDTANSLLTSVSWALYYPISTDSFGAGTLISSGSWTVSSSISRYSAQVSIPLAATTGLLLIFSVGAQTSGTWTIGDVQLEQGTQSTPFERRPIGLELSLCQRYYVQQQVEAQCPYNGGLILYRINFPVAMRIAPTVSNIVAGTVSNASVSSDAGNITPAGFFFQIAVSANNGFVSGRINACNSEL